jgi:hypothetical protein
VWAAQALMAGAGAWAYKTLTTPLEEVTVSLRVNMQSISGTSAVNFLKLRTASGTALAEVYITPAGRLGLRNSVTGIATNSAITFAPGLWRTLALRTVIAGDSSRLELSLDGAPVAGLQLTASLGTAPIGRVQVGENVPGRTAQFVYDGVVVTGAVPPTQVLFADGFETGFQNWTSIGLQNTDPPYRRSHRLAPGQYTEHFGNECRQFPQSENGFGHSHCGGVSNANRCLGRAE